uniref:Uncharacterized protein n=1 Tax=Prorocentrum micans TaxID=2945 RepID=A0A7S2X4X1_PROMC|mmetsp:Transcript_9414/g.7172  ORF Transcript_9414/g.7172 Transcript_9414/m.7172 type:complete len:204 (+) Transcript_9414:228-839(+)
MSRRRARSEITAKMTVLETMQTIQVTRSASLPPRPVGNGWAARLWDNMYSVQKEFETPKSALQEDVKLLLRKGQSLRSILRKVENVIGEVQVRTHLVKQQSEEFYDCVESESEEETKTEKASEKPAPTFTPPKRKHETKLHNVSQRVFNTFLYALAGSRKASSQNKCNSRKVNAHRKPTKPVKYHIPRPALLHKAATHLQHIM